MFEAAELGNRVSKPDYKLRERELHTRLLGAQRRLRATDTAVVVVVSGVEGAGKGTVVNRFNEWLDTRGVQTFAFWNESDEERERPRYWRFWRTLPPRGTVGVMFGSWYTRPIIDRAYERIDEAELDRELARIAEFEQMLAADGTLFVKLWFHLSQKEQRKRLKKEAKAGGKAPAVSPFTKKFSKRYDNFARVSERALRETDTGVSPWHVIEATDWRYRDLSAGTILLDALERKLAQIEGRAEGGAPAPPAAPAGEPELGIPGRPATILDGVNLTRTLGAKAYRRALAEHQRELYGLAWKAHAQGRHVVAVFEGWDAAGKGGAIRRMTAAMDARLYRVISVAAPTDEERAHHYLWRFWRHLPRAGYVTVYDRSWYGRVLVERVERFAAEHEWRRAYQEINDFEAQLEGHGVVLAKFWVHISAEEQLRRFEERGEIPWKQHKITDEDWRNREKWDEYAAAVNEMVARTSTEYAPWTLVAGNDKRFARVEVLRTVRERLEQAL